MADTTILGGDIGVTWFDNNRCKYLEWLGSASGTRTMNEVYSAMQTLQDETTTIDDGTCFSAETPTEYTIGKIDQGDNDPWFIQFDCMEHIKGGALKTSGWARVESSNTGIIVVPVTSGGAIVAADVGNNISMDTDGDTGTLLEVIDTGGSIDYLVIRPDSNAAANSFDNSPTSGDTMTCNAHQSTQSSASTTGDQIWANIYTIGTVESSVHMYIYQGAAATTDARQRVYSWNSASLDWYGNGHIDVVVPLKDITASTWSVIDDGYLNVFARKGGDLYASFEVANSVTSGGRNPVPLQTAVDLDQGTGTRTISFTGAVTNGPFTDGEIIAGGTGLGRGILDLTNSDVGSGGYLQYFPIATAANGGALTALQSGETVTGASSTAYVTTDGAPALAGPAAASWFQGSTAPDLILGYTNISGYSGVNLDIDNDTTDEHYGVLIDCNANPLSKVYEWVKYITQYGAGETDMVEQAFEDDLSQINIYGEEYIGATAYLTYSTITGTIAEGEAVIQNSGQSNEATGVVLSHDTTGKVVFLRSTRGTFEAGTAVISQDNSDQLDASGLTASNFAAKTASPLGTFAGGTFFGARGVLLTDWASADANSFILTDGTGNTYERPTSLQFTVTNLVGGTDKTVTTDDRVSWFQLTGSGGDVQKDMFGGVAGTPAAGDATLAVASTIQYIPDAGSLVIVQNPGSATATEYKVRYDSWSGTTFTLSNVVATGSISAIDTTTITASGDQLDGVKRTDLFYNATTGHIAYVTAVNTTTNVVTYAPADDGSPQTSDTVEFNCVPVALDTGDDVYVPYIDKIAESSEESASFIDPTTAIYYRVKVRNTRATTKIKPYSSDGNVTSANASVQVTRTEDTIIT